MTDNTKSYQTKTKTNKTKRKMTTIDMNHQKKKAKKKSKKVSFYRNVHVYPILHLNDYTPHEVERCFYDCDIDIQKFKQEAKLDALRLIESNNGGDIFYYTGEDADLCFCSRGIEYFTMETSLERRERRRKSINVVLEEQKNNEQQQFSNMILRLRKQQANYEAVHIDVDHDEDDDVLLIIAKEYSKAVIESVAIARNLGISDEIDANFIYYRDHHENENDEIEKQLINKKMDKKQPSSLPLLVFPKTAKRRTSSYSTS